MWLGGMTKAAGDLDMEVQYCMALASQILESAEYVALLVLLLLLPLQSSAAAPAADLCFNPA